MGPDSGQSKTLPASRRIAQVQSPIIPVVGRLIAAHPGTISLGQGVVHYGPPPQAIEGIARFLSDGENHKYQSVAGIKPLREAIERKLLAENGIEIGEAGRVIVTAGGNMAFVNAILAIADAGSELIIQRPYYFNHEMAIVMAGCAAVAVDTKPDGQLDVPAIAAAITPRTAAIVTISPNNPTGAVYGRESLEQVSELCRSRGIYHIHDEAYEDFTYERDAHFSPASLPGALAHTISLYSFSKAYGMASWRIGYMAAPAHLEVAIQKIQDTNLICAPVICQHAAIGALKAGKPWRRQRVAEMALVRELVFDELSSIGAFCETPRAGGAFYFLLRLDTPLSDMMLVERLIGEFGVAVIPGCTFGVRDACRLRVAYGALDRDSVAEGVGRLSRGLRAIIGAGRA